MTAKETSLAFVERMEKFNATLRPNADIDELLRLAKTAALIAEHRLRVYPSMIEDNWIITKPPSLYYNAKAADPHTAVRDVADKIREGK